MTVRRRLVRVPASSANLGPGYDVLAAAVSLFLELEVEETGEFSLDPGGLDVSTGRDNLIVRAFEALHPADGIAFRLKSEIPLARGLGSSAAAIVAGLFAADHLFELALSREELLARATEIEGHPDNVAAAIYGGFVICGGDGVPSAARFDPPDGLEGIAGPVLMAYGDVLFQKFIPMHLFESDADFCIAVDPQGQPGPKKNGYRDLVTCDRPFRWSEFDQRSWLVKMSTEIPEEEAHGVLP